MGAAIMNKLMNAMGIGNDDEDDYVYDGECDQDGVDTEENREQYSRNSYKSNKSFNRSSL